MDYFNKNVLVANVVAVLTMGFLTFVSAEEIQLDRAPEMETVHESERAGYSIKFPSSWDIKTGIMGTDVIALTPLEDVDDPFRENVNVIFTDLELPITREEYYSHNLKALQALLTDFHLEAMDRVDVDGEEAQRFIYTHRIGEIEAKVMQYLLLVNQRAYVITFTTDPDRFDDFSQVFNQVMETFDFTDIQEMDEKEVK